MVTLDERTETVQDKWTDAPLHLVIEHLVREHRSWRVKDFPMIEYLFDRLEGGRGPDQPFCLVSLRRAFYRLRTEMEGHMSREENILFPAIPGGQCDPAASGKPAFGSLRNPIAMLQQDHRRDAQLLAEMRAAARGYELPETAGDNLHVLFRELRALEAAMHAHTRVESSVLFARALQAERD